MLLEDPTATGLICIEEPENGIHPANLPAMLSLLQDLAIDPSLAPGDDNPLRQVIVTTHSPGLVQRCDPEDLLLAETHPRPAPDGSVARALALLPCKNSWRTYDDRLASFTKADVIPHIAGQPNARLTLEQFEAGVGRQAG